MPGLPLWRWQPLHSQMIGSHFQGIFFTLLFFVVFVSPHSATKLDRGASISLRFTHMLTCFLINYPGSSIISIPKLALVWPRPYNSFIYGADIAFVFLFHPLDRAAATERHNRRIAVIWSSLVRVTLPTRFGLGPAWNVLCCCCCCCCCCCYYFSSAHVGLAHVGSTHVGSALRRLGSR